MFLSMVWGLSTLFFLLGIISFSFVLWRRLKDDYPYETIFRFTLILAFFSLLGWVAGNRWLPEFSFWTGLLGASLVGAYTIKKLNLKFFEVIDALVVSLFWFLLFVQISSFLRFLEAGRVEIIVHNYLFTNIGRQAIGNIVLAVVMVILCSFFQKRFRRFSWYPSGKVGFVGLASFLVFLPTRSALVFFTSSLRVSAISVIIGLVLAIAIAVLIYKRSGRKM